MKILIAEDDEQLYKIYQMKFASAGFEVRLAKDGEEALQMISEWEPKVILLDLLMPKKDGYQVLTELKNNPDRKSIPVIVTSNLSQSIEIEKVKQAGAADYIIKSNTSLDDLIQKVKSYM